MKEKAFGSNEKIGTMNAGLKLKSTQEPRKEVEDFDQKIRDYKKNENEIFGLVAELSLEYIKAVQDKTISANKTAVDKDKESATVDKLIKLAMALNNDENLDEGYGSIGLIVILMKALLHQRNSINDLRYEVFQLKNSNVK